MSIHQDSNPTILLFTNAEYGQANVFFSVAYELGTTSQSKIHVASFRPFHKRIEGLQVHIAREGAMTFHTVAGLSYEEALAKRGKGAQELVHPGRWRGAIECLGHFGYGLVPWSVEEYYEQLVSIQSIIEKVNPGLVVIDSLFFGAQDVCRGMKKKVAILTPNSIKDIIGLRQPWLKGFWKYPCVSTGYPFPIPLHLIPANLYVTFRMIYTIATQPHLKAINHLRKELYGLSNPITHEFTLDTPYILPSTPETDFPGLLPTPNLTCCGPIVVPSFKSIDEDDELKTWLEESGRQRTVLINLGSHAVSGVEAVRQIAGGIRILLADRSLSDSEEGGNTQVQFLWKLLPDEAIRTALREVIKEEMKEGVVRVVDWLEVEPRVILEHPNVVCSVHHGGANSFFETIDAGVPHIVLPVWHDTYDYASRVETLGIGVWGSQRSAPFANDEEFGNALKRVLNIGSREAELFQSNAVALKAKVNRYGGGRKVAAERILELSGVGEATSCRKKRVSGF
ncbi:hypothetical protein E1B28_009666 [Marasmius oreades]|uniref:Uncharacterized protein n=1 Tax=Marasmius oreades TaxID=181124 RepID=A0A9P7UQP6_9AGAR|nr:uncharacterized protein E1B28_009666 [Marasmius oreades]KAG7090558.1 hypothetical protein E1B28_009666 [Marasmius oreades]